MPPSLIWTEPRDQELALRRRAGATWDVIAAAMGISRNAAIERARKIGARVQRPAPPEPAPADQPDRLALPAGHPLTWNLLNAGTSLAGAPYPYPVFADNPRRY